MKTLKVFRPLILLFTLIFFQSCEQSFLSSPEDCLNYDYSDCNTSEPSMVPMNIKLTINAENPQVPITIYKGKLEGYDTVLSDTVGSASYIALLLPDNYYTVEARYKSGNNIIYAIGGDNIKKIHKQVCDSVCWTVQEGNVNVELK